MYPMNANNNNKLSKAMHLAVTVTQFFLKSYILLNYIM